MRTDRRHNNWLPGVARLLTVSFALLILQWSIEDNAHAKGSPGQLTLENIEPLPFGKHRFQFSGWAGPKINVWTYRPEQADQNTPIVFVMHGTNRDADRYRNEWVRHADRHNFIVVAPEFSRRKFPNSRSYNLGGVYREGGRGNRGRIKEERWTFSAIEPLFDEVKQRTRSVANEYYIYGHSAGSQFVHRFVYFKPNARFKLAVAANAGWYTLPSVVAEYPYGLGKSFLGEEHVRAALSKDMIVLLGTDDINTESSSLRRNAQANAQGPHRLARGKTFHEAGRLTAEIYEIPFNWRLEYAPEVGHSNRGMAEFAAPLIAEAAQLSH